MTNPCDLKKKINRKVHVEMKMMWRILPGERNQLVLRGTTTANKSPDSRCVRLSEVAEKKQMIITFDELNNEASYGNAFSTHLAQILGCRAVILPTRHAMDERQHLIFGSYKL